MPIIEYTNCCRQFDKELLSLAINALAVPQFRGPKKKVDKEKSVFWTPFSFIHFSITKALIIFFNKTRNGQLF